MFTRRFFILFCLCIAVAICGIFWEWMVTVTKVMLYVLGVASVIDFVAALWGVFRLKAKREVSEHLSLDQPNLVKVDIMLRLPKGIAKCYKVVSYDTVPQTFTGSDGQEMHGAGPFTYTVTPALRGKYEFGAVRCFVSTKVLNLICLRRFLWPKSVVKVYPTFHRLDKLEVSAAMHTREGMRRTRRKGNNSTEFEQIRSYVPGDDVRTINWRATARAVSLMVNTYSEERSQSIIPIVCAGPSMLIATDGISLIDRSVSAAIALASSAIRHYDKAGLITVTHNGVDTYMEPDRSPSVISKMLERTYDFGLAPTPSEQFIIDDPDVLPDEVTPQEYAVLRERMDACEADADLDALADYVTKRLLRRSLLVLFANFENIAIAQAALPALQRIGRRHTLVLVLFENEGVEAVAKAPYREGRVSSKLSEQRFRTMCANYLEEQQRLAAYLHQHHINVVLTTPKNLSGAVLQKYLEIKSRGIM